MGDVMNSIKINDHQMGKFNFDTVLKFTPSRIYRHMDRSSGTGTHAEDEDKCMSIGGRRLLRRLTRGGWLIRPLLPFYFIMLINLILPFSVRRRNPTECALPCRCK